ncbi:Uncharacterised protein [uncultured archaeon]|nr:Uncharacterised protein [uncultured archaeon]
MPAKKAKKVAAEEGCECMCHKGSNIKSWLLLVLGAAGLLNAMGILTMGIWSGYFQYVWSVVVLVVGMTMLIEKQCECC